MTYNVFGGTLSLTRSINYIIDVAVALTLYLLVWSFIKSHSLCLHLTYIGSHRQSVINLIIASFARLTDVCDSCEKYRKTLAHYIMCIMFVSCNLFFVNDIINSWCGFVFMNHMFEVEL